MRTAADRRRVRRELTASADSWMPDAQKGLGMPVRSRPFS
jgi:hypothetical protein